MREGDIPQLIKRRWRACKENRMSFGVCFDAFQKVSTSPDSVAGSSASFLGARQRRFKVFLISEVRTR
jgi:hypothetical protein